MARTMEPLTAAEQIVRERTLAALAALNHAEEHGKPADVAAARLECIRARDELDKVRSASGSAAMAPMKRALKAK